MPLNNTDSFPSREQHHADAPSASEQGPNLVVSETALIRPLLESLRAIAGDIKRIADKLDPPPAAIVGSRYVADRLGQTTTWVADMARRQIIPRDCLVSGTGNGKPWKFYRTKIDAWLTRR